MPLFAPPPPRGPAPTTGAAGGLFAPPYVSGNPQAVNAATAYNTARQAQVGRPAIPPDIPPPPPPARGYGVIPQNVGPPGLMPVPGQFRAPGGFNMPGFRDAITQALMARSGGGAPLPRPVIEGPGFQPQPAAAPMAPTLKPRGL